MNRIIKLIMAGIVCLHIPSANAKIQFRNRISITAYKIDPATHNDTWSIQTTNSPERGAATETILSSSIVRSSMANICLLKNWPTYVFVYKNDKASGDPIVSTITPAQIKAVGSNLIMVINADGTATITTQNRALAKLDVDSSKGATGEPRLDRYRKRSNACQAIKHKHHLSYSTESNNKKSRR